MTENVQVFAEEILSLSCKCENLKYQLHQRRLSSTTNHDTYDLHKSGDGVGNWIYDRLTYGFTQISGVFPGRSLHRGHAWQPYWFTFNPYGHL